MAKSEVNGDILTTLTMESAVFTLFIAVEVSGDINVKFARAAVTNKNVSSLPFRRESPETEFRSIYKHHSNSDIQIRIFDDVLIYTIFYLLVLSPLTLHVGQDYESYDYLRSRVK